MLVSHTAEVNFEVKLDFSDRLDIRMVKTHGRKTRTRVEILHQVSGSSFPLYFISKILAKTRQYLK